jgi:hypothetical protein
MKGFFWLEFQKVCMQVVEGSFKGPRQSWEVWGRWFLSMKIHRSFEGSILLLCLPIRGITHGLEKALKASK